MLLDFQICISVGKIGKQTDFSVDSVTYSVGTQNLESALLSTEIPMLNCLLTKTIFIHKVR